MGNTSSQDIDNENLGSTYNYHERVLRDAQQLGNVNRGGYESDDQYFSAEEGDSDGSVTPPRNRPESSSGEDFSDGSASDDGDQQMREELQTDAAISHRTESDVFSPGVRTLRVKKHCGQCNVSRFQEHDSIGPELDTSRWDVSNNMRTTRNSQRSLGQMSYSDIDSSNVQIHGLSSPFVPISSPLASHNLSQVSAGSFMGKRRVQNSEDAEATSPKKKKLLKISPNKRGLGVFDDSDSDSDKEGGGRARKQPRHSRCAEGGKLIGSPTLAEQRSILNLKRKVQKNDESNDSLDEDQRADTKIRKMLSSATSENAFRGKRRVETQSAIDGEESIGQPQRLKSKKADNLNSDNYVTNTTDQVASGIGVTRKEAKSLDGGAFQPLRTANACFSNEPKQEDGNSPTKTVKMGNNAIRNSQGKILPIRNSYQCPSSLSNTNVTESLNSTSTSAKISQSEPALLGSGRQVQVRIKRIDNHGRRDNSLAGGALMQNANSLSFSNVNTESGVFKESENSGLNNRSGRKRQNEISSPSNPGKEKDDSDCVSPFRNVVLTPPSSLVSTKDSKLGLQKRTFNDSHSLEMEEDCYDSQNEKEPGVVAMETDESQLNESSGIQPGRQRTLAKAKRLSTAERFKHFFTESNLKSNFKTLFFKKKSGKRESDSNNSSNQSAWSLYSSPSSSVIRGSSFSNFQSTSSPIDKVHSFTTGNVNFSPIVSNTSASKPSSSFSHQMKRLTSSTSSLAQENKESEPLQKSVSATRLPCRTSPRLRSPRSTPSVGLGNTSNASASSRSPVLSLSSHVELLPQTSEFQVLHYQLCETLEISLSMGDIADQTTSGIVNWTDGSLTHTATDCSRRICAKAGALMRAGCNSYLENKDGILEAPDVLTTPAGGRFPRCVRTLLHVVSPPISTERMDACLLEVNANCLRFANERHGLDSLSLPLIGEGELPTQLCAEAFIDAVLIFLTEKKPLSTSISSSLTESELTSIHLVTSDANITDQAAEVIQARISLVKSSGLESVVADIRGRYFKQIDHSVVIGEAVPDFVDRATSGRPRVKRPRL